MEFKNRPNLSGFRRDINQGTSGTPAVSDSLDSTLPADSIVSPQPVDQMKPPKKVGNPWIRVGGIAAIVIGILLGALLIMHTASENKKQAALNASEGQLSARVKQQSIALPSISNTLVAESKLSKSTLTVNGQVTVASSMVLQPSTKPSSPVSGQMYYDQNTNQLSYYNGTQFVTVQGGGGSYTSITNVAGNTTNNFAGNTTNVTNNNVTNVTNITNSGGVGVGAVNGTAGSIAMFTDPNDIGDSMITQSGNDLSTGSGVENVTLGSASGASTGVLQAGTGGITLQTGAQPGTSGTITIESGASSTQAAGNIDIDTGGSIVTGTVVSDRGFEDDTQDNFTDGFGYHDTLAVSNTVAHSGSHSLQITEGLSPINQPEFEIADQEPFVTPGIIGGHLYHFSLWVLAGSTSDAVQAYVNWSSTGFNTIETDQFGTGHDNSSSWTQISGNIVAPAGAINLSIELTGYGTAAGELHYLDDVTVTDLDSSASIANLNLGTVNAQQVTLGNANEIGPTSIFGGGINLNAGNGNFNVQGGAFQQTTSIATLQTTTGALNLISNGAATWETQEQGGFGQPLTIKTGDANGGSYNGGNLSILAGNGADNGVGGSITIDNDGVNNVSGAVVSAIGFEDGTDNMLGSLNDSVFQSNTASQAGNFSLDETSTAAGDWQVTQDQTQAGAPVTAGDSYYFSAYVRAASTDEAVQSFIDWGGAGSVALNTVTESGIQWMHITGVATAPVGVTQAFWNFQGTDGGGETNYFDDLTVTDLGASLGVNELNLGSYGMQGINIGNEQEVAATTIQGGNGIDIDSASSTLSLSGGTVNVQTPADVGTTGNINIETGASSSTASGNISIDTGPGIVTGTVIQDKTFESGTDNIIAWTGGATVAQDCSVAHSGLCSLAVSGSNFWGTLEASGTGAAIVAGHHYFVSLWVKAATASTPISGALIWNVGGFDTSFLTLATVNTSTAGWTEMSASGTAPAGATQSEWRIGGNGGTSNGVQYIDDMTITDLSSSSSASEIDIGTNNAQIMNIGNMDQIAAMNIDGGSGINLNSGTANFNINGGAINVIGSGASNLQTTSGALDISSAGAAVWNVAQTVGGGVGGSLSIQAGDANGGAGSDNVGGNLVLQAGLGSGSGTSGSVQVGTGSGATLGYTTAGNFGESDFNSAINADKFTTTTGGTVESMSVRIGDFGLDPPPDDQYQVAIYTDNAGAPGTYIASSAVGTLASTAAWNTIPITATLSPATTYWLVYWTNAVDSGGTNAEIGTTGSGTNYHVADTWQSGLPADNNMPASIPSGGVFNTIKTSIYATFTGSAPALTIDPFGSLNENGTATFQASADVPNAFQIQNSAGASLLTADTSTMTITVESLVVAVTLTVDGHIVSGGGTPTFTAGAAACTTPTITVTGTDTSGTVSITTGSGCTLSGTLATVNFSNAYTNPPHVSLTPGGSDALSLGAYVNDSTIGDSSFDIGTNTVPTDATTYQWNYLVIQ